MPLPPSPLLIAGWRTTTPFTRIPGWATAHPANTFSLNPLRVRFNGVNSTRQLGLHGGHGVTLWRKVHSRGLENRLDLLVLGFSERPVMPVRLVRVCRVCR